MTDFSWLAEVEALSPAALTVRAQAISPNDNGRLLWDAFMPRSDVDSVDMASVTSLDFRPAADRREWNAPGRYIPILTPGQKKLSMVPIEAYDKIEEREMQKLMERALGNEAIIRQIIEANLPQRAERLATADYRRVELDVFTAWALGQVTQRNPQTGQDYTVNFGFDASRYQTVPTAWSDPTLNAYDEFVAWLEDAIDAVGSIGGAVMRLAEFKAIQVDAPQGINAVRLTRAQVQDRISQDLGTAFTIYTIENTVDVFVDGGITTARQKVWPAGVIAAVPAGDTVGTTAFAPVARAMQLSAAVPDASIDIRGVTLYHTPANNGKELSIDAQLNAMPLPDEQRMYVIDVVP